jgi:peptidase A4-like protein
VPVDTLTPMSRRSMPFLMLALVGVLSVAAIIVSVNTDVAARVAASRHPSGPSGNPFGGPEYAFGGYSISVHTTEIGAEWRVPTIRPHSADGDASTWIAVQNFERDFIQIGTTENKVNGVALYGIFWSDVTVGFHPQQLLYVSPGDLIRFTMVQTPRGWRLSFDDLTNNTPETINVPYAPGAYFDSAQWLQEDPTIGGPAHHEPYPSMSLTTFTHLTVNDVVPRLRADDGQALSTADGVYVIPTVPKGDEFSFTNATGATRQLLSDLYAYNVALYPLQADIFDNRAPSGRVLRKIVSSLATMQTKFESPKWPAPLAGVIGPDGKKITDVENAYANFPESPGPISPMSLNRLFVAQDRFNRVIDGLERTLGLQPTQ